MEEHYIDKIIEIFEQNGLTWDSLFVSYIHTNDLPVQIEASPLFKIPMDSVINTIDVFGVEMESAVDNKELKPEETIHL